MENKIAKCNRNLYDANTGLSIMINLYVIKYIYYHIQKADCFIEKKQNGKKAKSRQIYGQEIPMSRQRMDRINKGMSFEVTAGEADYIVSRFGIDMRYFRKEEPIAFQFDNIEDVDWKCFYNVRYDGDYNLPSGYTKRESVSRADKVENELRKLTDGNWEKSLKKTDPIYAICYYFHYGKRFDELNKIETLRKSLEAVSYIDWEKEDIEALKTDYLTLQKHCSYINSLITIDKLRKEK